MRGSRLWARGYLVLLCIAFALSLAVDPQSALARAGGGEGYSGGGGHGGGGGGGDGGGGGHGGGGVIIWLLFQLIFRYPIIGIPLLILIVVLYFRAQGNAAAGPPGPIAPSPGLMPMPAPTLDPSARESAIAHLRANDPNFQELAFFKRVEVAFLKIQAAWCGQNLTAVRPFISDGVHERFTLQFAEQKAEGWRDQMDQLMIHSIAMTELHTDGQFDELSVRVEASAADYHVALADGRPLARPGPPERFAEVWSFLRRRGAITLNKAGLIEGNCPNCGAAIEMNQSANCANCKALLRSGEYDWVLSEITQEVEWSGERHGELPGVRALRLRDPDFNAVELEDRASVVFWRKETADRLGKIDPIRKVASEAFCAAYAPMLKPGPSGQRQMYVGSAVGSVNLLGVITDDTGGAGERAIVEIRWSGARAMASPGQPPRIVDENRVSHTLYVLWRKSNSVTDVGKGISSAHCPNCGAPASNSASSACDFCGTVLNDGSRGWVLIDILNKADSRATQLLAQLRGG